MARHLRPSRIWSRLGVPAALPIPSARQGPRASASSSISRSPDGELVAVSRSTEAPTGHDGRTDTARVGADDHSHARPGPGRRTGGCRRRHGLHARDSRVVCGIAAFRATADATGAFTGTAHHSASGDAALRRTGRLCRGMRRGLHRQVTAPSGPPEMPWTRCLPAEIRRVDGSDVVTVDATAEEGPNGAYPGMDAESSSSAGFS